MARSILFAALLSLLAVLCIVAACSKCYLRDTEPTIPSPTATVQAQEDDSPLYYVPSDDDWYWDHITPTIC